MDNEGTQEPTFLKQDLQIVLDKLYRCRDLEISNLWQRSIFLSVFLILSFTGYGFLIIEILKDFQKINLNLIALAVSSVSIIFSIVWIMMAKASKSWYEVYERAIYQFEGKHFTILGFPEENRMGNMNVSLDQLSTNPFSLKGGPYSPSRIKILLGQLNLVIWFTVYITYTIYLIYNNEKCLTIIAAAMLIIIIFLSIFLVRSKFVKSDFLGE